MQLFAQDQQQSSEAIEYRKLKQEQALLDARIEVEKKKIELRLLQEAQPVENLCPTIEEGIYTEEDGSIIDQVLKDTEDLLAEQ